MPSEIATPSPVSLDRSAAVVDAPPLAAPQGVVKKSTKSHLVSGFISGLTSSVLLQPLDNGGAHYAVMPRWLLAAAAVLVAIKVQPQQHLGGGRPAGNG